MKHRKVGIIVCAFCVSLWLGSASFALTQSQTALNEAAALLQSHRFDEAEAATRKILTTNPKNAEAHALLALILDQRGNHSEAEREYQAALKLKPNLVSALSNFGVLLARTNRPTEAIAKFEEVLQLDPKHGRAICNLGAVARKGCGHARV
jgi:Flp pilus assembly protein TadD